MRKGRVLFILFMLTVLICGLTYRLYRIQILKHEAYSASAFRQRSRITEIYQQRGQILDRNMIPFTGRNTEMMAVLTPAIFPKEKWIREQIAEILETNTEEFSNFSMYNAMPRIYAIEESRALQLIENPLPGICVVERRKRTDEHMPAAHLIGYTDESGAYGMAGIEKIFQNILSAGNSVYALATTDANNGYLDEYGYRMSHVDGRNPLSIRLTLDYHMQKLAEEVMDSLVPSGAVTVIDILSGDILVLASRPGFNPTDISGYLHDENQPLFNRAIAGYTPGSIFKIITAAAVLESGDDKKLTFYCPGYVNIGEQTFKCWIYEQGGHGTMDLKNGFAQSCNSFFIQMGLHLGCEKMLNMAKQFGLGFVTGLSIQNIPEYEGMLPKKEEMNGDGNIANLSIGQGKVLVTPLQAANMAAIIANGGIRNKLNIIDCIVNQEGEIIRDMKKREWERAISRETALSLMELMEATVDYGTGQRADIRGYGGSAGKTGSAETGLFENGRRIIHAWFTGYFPYDEPRYAMCVFVEDGTGGGTSAAPVFAEIAAHIMQWEEMR